MTDCSDGRPRPREVDVAALIARYGPMVFRRCRQLLRDYDDAMDACQDVFVRLLERRTRLDGRFPSSLLYTMATNICLNRLRTDGRRPNGAHGRAPGSSVADDRLERIACLQEPGGASDARLLLDWLFGRNPESSRTIAMLHYVDGLTVEEVAEAVSMSVSGVKKRLRKLRAMLTDMTP